MELAALKDRLRPILADATLTRRQRGERLAVVAKEHWLAYGEEEFDAAADAWNGVMADLVQELRLARH